MRFTPTGFVGSSVGTSLIATATGAQSGSFISGGINYGFLEFTTGSASLSIAIGANVDILLVGGGGGGRIDGLAPAGNGGGGGAVRIVSTRLLRGDYTISVGTGGTANGDGQSTTLTGYNLLYTAGFGRADGVSGDPQFNAPGNNIQCTVQNNTGGGGGGSSAMTGSNAYCNGSNLAYGGAGGEGLTYNFDGTASIYGSGGGGGSSTSAFAQGGAGGTNAGVGASYNTTASNAINGFGGGGGGERAGNTNQAGTGGNGTLIIRYTI